ncbi:MAG TPA: hypothetical protein VL356_11770 [Acidocella sp.]|nr:hypothetical protein [Acidocella sp.]
MPSAILRSEISGAAMGFINMGNLGGFLGPFAVGYVRNQTGNGFAGFLLLSVSLLIFAGLITMVGGDRRAAQLRAAFTPGSALAPSGGRLRTIGAETSSAQTNRPRQGKGFFL